MQSPARRPNSQVAQEDEAPEEAGRMQGANDDPGFLLQWPESHSTLKPNTQADPGAKEIVSCTRSSAITGSILVKR